jgi:16S rRNA processing protein RimM
MIVLGRIAGAFGVDGWVRVHPFGDDPLSWRLMRQWWLADDSNSPEAGWQGVKPFACRLQGDALLVKFAHIQDRTQAELLRGKWLGAPRDALPATGQDEYYWTDLIGLPVRNAQGVSFGEVVDLIESGAHSVLQVRDLSGEIERLLPFTAQVVIRVSLQDGPSGPRGIDVEWGEDWGRD